ncbi:hypothetical protein ACPWML_25760, partial [Pandoraea pneumonica]|uniref:hypothetical protein n=1 Tax=Pandoraea pneumonica TaxID=2508299 RepID=UPI003CF9646E
TSQKIDARTPELAAYFVRTQRYQRVMRDFPSAILKTGNASFSSPPNRNNPIRAGIKKPVAPFRARRVFRHPLHQTDLTAAV